MLRRFLQTAEPPATGWIAGAAAHLGLTGTAMTELEAADFIHAANGVVSVAYPFSGTPTRQQVELDDFPAVYAMCAIDAPGIPAMAGRDGRITAVDHRDGAPVVVSVRGDLWRWTLATAVVVAGITRGRPPTDDKPTVTLEPPRDSDRVSSLLNIRVAEINTV